MKRKTLLIAYQDDLWTPSLTAFFQGIGYKVQTARAVSEMIRRIRKKHIPVVVIDDEIEGVKACDVVPLLKHLHLGIQIIVISSGESIGLAKRLRGAGIFYQAMKPVDLTEIKAAVECAFAKVERESATEGFSFFSPQIVPA